MRSRAEVVSSLLNPGVIAVIRAENSDQAVQACDALIAGGVIALELTMTTPNALKAIEQAAAKFGDKALVGVGSVLNARTAQEAIRAGAEFVVSPITKLEIADAAHESDRPVMLGAYTPTEAQVAFEKGADFIKIFPADGLGPGYIKSLHMLLPHLQIIPTGGVDLETASTFVKAGCVAVGVGSSLVSPKLLRDQNWSELTRLASEFVRLVREARNR
jgi:2-dehydro-3-deoxyphosphogluconate aldolase / (4S)-4-hydroxy-2-oxoglutarate aldolase